MSNYVCFFISHCGYAEGCTHFQSECMWLGKYRLFYVVFTRCFSVSLMGGWLNESFGQRLRYQKEWFGLEMMG